MTDQEKQAIQVKIDEETQNIEELKAEKIPYDSKLGRWDEYNRPFEIHQVKIRDAYWRRRMLTAKLEEADEATMTATASYY